MTKVANKAENQVKTNLENENNKMKAVVRRQDDSSSNHESCVDTILPVPESPTGHNLLVQVEAVSATANVKAQRSFGADTGDEVYGFDAVGIVEQSGADATLFHPGDKVWYAGDITRPGSYAQFQLVDERIVGHAPKTLKPEEAAALPLTGLTAWETLFDKLHLSEDSKGTLLVIGAAGGVGSILIQLAKQLTKLNVIALASKPESQMWVRKMGADYVLDYHASDLAKQILEIAPNGVDYAFSAYSKTAIPLLAQVMRPFGEIVAIDDQHGHDMDYYALKDKALSWHWELMFARSKHHASDLIRQHDILERLAELADKGIIHTTATTQLDPINAETVNQAQNLIATSHEIGKITIAGWPSESK
ncbi:zinc-binding alcohol dehydrogenase family protein [Bifidobacterium sp. ESL0745]|uniref:zinc-binding alcohol dehydrogenase family protein n=1 Tax=Bifidobacterium sp. ESL0745 TaxID=2983226 RepID=UPI0023F951E5|nr:zinc-binding alcohol dehydrogenase family protein [Bifidobacterium sp. ESL0745]MDF7665043.1 zinc-binding alcohol dehydrogenase family protein [Bifidobacterium sp. ESL0745]